MNQKNINNAAIYMYSDGNVEKGPSNRECNNVPLPYLPNYYRRLGHGLWSLNMREPLCKNAQHRPSIDILIFSSLYFNDKFNKKKQKQMT